MFPLKFMNHLLQRCNLRFLKVEYIKNKNKQIQKKVLLLLNTKMFKPLLKKKKKMGKNYKVSNFKYFNVLCF